MEFAFYLASAIAIFSALRVVTNTRPVHALLYMVISLLAVSVIFFILGAPFAGALEVIVYAGGIMVLFVFVVMLLNLGPSMAITEQEWLRPQMWTIPTLLTGSLLALLLYALSHNTYHIIGTKIIDAKHVGIALFGPYLLVVELASLLLLAALVVAWHLGRPDYKP